MLLTTVVLTMILAVHCETEEEVSFKNMVTAQFDAFKSKIAELENRLEAMENGNMILHQHSIRSKRETTFYPENVVFTASLSKHVKHLTAHQPIIFGNTLTNFGNHYNNVTGVFYAPVSGTYQFFVNILSEADNFIETQLVVNGNEIAEIYSGAENYNGAGSNLVIVRLNKGDKVWVRVHASYSSDMAVHCCWSTFSGLLVREIATQSQIVG